MAYSKRGGSLALDLLALPGRADDPSRDEQGHQDQDGEVHPSSRRQVPPYRALYRYPRRIDRASLDPQGAREGLCRSRRGPLLPQADWSPGDQQEAADDAYP